MLPSVIRIPVVVHVIHNGDALGSGENIADAQVMSQITVLNQDYRRMTGTPGFGTGVDTTIEFCMAQIDPSGNATNGIVRHNITPYTNNVADANGADWETMDDIELAKANTIWDPTKYMNMWTFRFGGNTLANGGVSDLLGFAQFPSGSGLAGMPAEDCIAGEAATDGLTMSFGTFGSRAIFPGGNYSDTQYDKGRTATHEIGHGFGLRHIWGDANDCSGDDYCADVPSCSGQYYSAEATCTAPVQCGSPRQIENYMDYSDDTCMNKFTQNQKDRMLAVLQNSPRRDDLLVSPVCNAPTASIQFKRGDCSTRLMNTDVNEGTGVACNGYTEYTVPLTIEKAPTQNAVVTFSIDGTSVANASDINFQTPTVTFPSGSTAERNFVFRVLNDAIVEANENLVISFTVNANGGDAFAHLEGNKLTLTIVNDDVAPSVTLNSTLLNKNFEDLTDWTLLDGNGDGVNWGLIDADGLGTAPNTITGTCAYSRRVTNQINNYLISPQITIPTGANSVNLSYIIGGFQNTGSPTTNNTTAGLYTVYFATNVSTATAINGSTVLMAASTIPNVNGGATLLNTQSLLSLAGQTGYIVFRHNNSNSATAPYLLLDNVSVIVNSNTVIQTAVNTGTQFNSNVPVNGSFVARDASTQNLMADITSSTNFNYGCTTVAVDRAGTSAVNYGSGTAANLRVMSKRFVVTPANVHTSATGTVKFYFTEAEIAGWEAATTNSRSALRIIKDGVATPLTTMLSTFGANTTLQANVANGISGTYYFGTVATLGRDNFEFASLNLYPNPNKGNFTIELESDSNSDIKVSVADLRGRQIFDRKYANNGTFNQNIYNRKIQMHTYLNSDAHFFDKYTQN